LIRNCRSSKKEKVLSLTASDFVASVLAVLSAVTALSNGDASLIDLALELAGQARFRSCNVQRWRIFNSEVKLESESSSHADPRRQLFDLTLNHTRLHRLLNSFSSPFHYSGVWRRILTSFEFWRLSQTLAMHKHIKRVKHSCSHSAFSFSNN
jgi:predicted component of type VI protein secretion system